MATLEQLVQSKELVPLTVRLARDEFADRRIYAAPAFVQWLKNDVMKAEAFYSDDIAPKLQAHAILNQYISGKPMRGSRMFKRLSPSSDDVWELRTPDLRFFGWVPEKDVFIAVCGDLFGNLKADKSLYETHRIATKKVRDSMNLDEPKFLQGATENDIVSE